MVVVLILQSSSPSPISISSPVPSPLHLHTYVDGSKRLVAALAVLFHADDVLGRERKDVVKGLRDDGALLVLGLEKRVKFDPVPVVVAVAAVVVVIFVVGVTLVLGDGGKEGEELGAFAVESREHRLGCGGGTAAAVLIMLGVRGKDRVGAAAGMEERGEAQVVGAEDRLVAEALDFGAWDDAAATVERAGADLPAGGFALDRGAGDLRGRAVPGDIRRDVGERGTSATADLNLGDILIVDKERKGIVF